MDSVPDRGEPFAEIFFEEFAKGLGTEETNQRDDGMGPMRTWSAAAAFVAALIAVDAEAAPCPRAFVHGPDAEIVAELEDHLGPVTSSPKGSTPVNVEVFQEKDGLHLVRQVEGLRIERVVRRTETAAALISAWTLSGSEAFRVPLTLLAPGAPRFLPASAHRRTKPIRPARRPFGLTRRRVASPSPAEDAPFERSYLSASLLGSTSGASVDSPGLEVAWVKGFGAWRFGLVLRSLYTRAPDSVSVSGAHVYDIGVGLRLGRWFGSERLGVRPEAGAMLAVSHVVPTQYIGITSCTNDIGCNDATVQRLPSPAYQAATVWFDAGASGEWWLSDDLGVGLGLNFAVNTGQSADEPGALFASGGQRLAPSLARWRSLLRISFLWASS